jgi:hypothetical protein
MEAGSGWHDPGRAMHMQSANPSFEKSRVLLGRSIVLRSTRSGMCCNLGLSQVCNCCVHVWYAAVATTSAVRQFVS